MADDALNALFARADALSRPRTAPPSALAPSPMEAPAGPPRSAADVRALHPGVYDDLTDAQIEAGLQRQTTPDDGRFKAFASPDEPLYGAMTRYGVQELKGAANALTPSNLWAGIKALPGAVAKGWTQDIPALLRDPSLLTEAPDAAGDFLQHPEDVGGTLASVVAGETAPPLLGAAGRVAPAAVGRGLGALGRAAETAGTSKLLKRAQSYAPMEILTGHPAAAAVSATVPALLEHGGKLAQRAGSALEGLDLAAKGQGVVDAVNSIPGRVASAFDSPSGIESHPYVRAASSDIPYRAGGGADVAGARGAEQSQANALVRKLARTDDSAWANDMSAMKDTPEPTDLRTSPAMEGLRKAVKQSTTPRSPIEEFYANDPQARIGGEGRMTGQFEEGRGGLSDIASGNYERNPMPRPAGGVAADPVPQGWESPDEPFEGRNQLPGYGVPRDLMGRRLKPPPSESVKVVPEGAGPLSPLDALSRASGRAQFDTPEPLSPAEQLLQLPGMMSDAEVRAAQDLKWRRGQAKTPSAETLRAERKGRE